MAGDERHGRYITTVLNTRLYLADMRPQDLDPRFIACGLARECRWSGQLFEFYSVAQHCTLVSELVDRWYVATTDTEREHKRILRACAHTHAWLELPREMPHVVHRADMVVRAAEARDLRSGLGYSGSDVDTRDVPTIVPWNTHYAEARWLRDFNTLFGTSFRPASPKATVYYDRLESGVDDSLDEVTLREEDLYADAVWNNVLDEEG